jgi:ribonucleoside-diphosphate reductase alpha chain
LAWELGCKGITVYVTGSRQKVVLETNHTAKQKHTELRTTSPAASAASTDGEQLDMWQDKKKPRPRSLHGYTYSVSTPLGKAFITLNENGNDHPFEVFINTAKAGSDTAAVSEAIGRLISYILRLASPVAPLERLKEVWRQLSGIGGGRASGFGPNRVRSLPDGVAQVIAEYLEMKTTSDQVGDSASAQPHSAIPDDDGHYLLNERWLASEENEAPYPHKVGDLCPECGQAAVVNEEGCRKCYACGFSEC